MLDMGAKIAVKEMDGADCYWCGIKLSFYKIHYKKNPPKFAATLDHLIPKSQGGSNAVSNLVLSCRKCNNTRGDIGPMQWAEKCGVQLPERFLIEQGRPDQSG